MLRALLAVFSIVSSLPAANRDDAAPGTHAVEVFRCNFDDAADVDYNLWPDGWTRMKGPGYPQYLEVGIVSDQGPEKSGPEKPERALEVRLDGGACKLFSPNFPADSRYSYVLEAKLRTESLEHDIVSVGLSFLDGDATVFETIESDNYRGTQDWTQVRIGAVAPDNARTQLARITLHVRPAGREDLSGRVYLSDIKVSRLPRMSLRAGGAKHLYMVGQKVEVSTDISGISATDDQVLFELLDPHGKQLAREVKQLQSVNGSEQQNAEMRVSNAKWNAPVSEPGFYHVRVSMAGDNGLVLERTITLAIVKSQSVPSGGEFGWTLPDGERPLDFNSMATLLAHAGVNWVKFPAWYGDEDRERPDRIAWFAERLSLSEIEMVGIFDHPPPDQRKLFGDSENLTIANVLAEPEIWHPVLDPVMTRLSLKVGWWQIGADSDLSYSGYSDVAKKLQDIKQPLARYGQSLRLGIPWRSMNHLESKTAPPCEFLIFTDEPPLAAEEIVNQFNKPLPNLPARWLSLVPLNRSEYDLKTRVADLAERMVAVKRCHLDAAFIPRPFDDEQGLFQSDGTPGELFLPWRTTALALSGRTYLGSLKLQGGSTNHVFANQRDAVMVIWNDRQVTEQLFLDDTAKCLDLWGKETELESREVHGFTVQSIPAGPEPRLITGINGQLMRWYMSFDFETPRLQSWSGREQNVAFKVANAFNKGVTGQVTLHAPTLWDASPSPIPFRLPAGQQRSINFNMVLKNDADSGQQPVRVDFELRGDKLYRFSLFRTLTVGLDDVLVEHETRMIDGKLQVSVHVTNSTGRPVNFQCVLFAPARRREQQSLMNLGPDRTTLVFQFPQGEELLGKSLQLRLEEIGGSRVLNHHVPVQK